MNTDQSMEENNQFSTNDKPFSILDKFRQLKKDTEEPTVSESDKNGQSSQISKTVFQTSTTSPNEKFRGRRGGFRGGRRGRDSNESYWKMNRLPVTMYKGQSESEVGITEYLRDGPGFEAIIKHRYTDFHVNEIDLDGKVLKLTTREIPPDEEPENLTDEEALPVLTSEQWEELQEIVDKGLVGQTVDIDVTDIDKNERQNIHKAVKKKFGVHIFSNTKEEGSKRIMKIGWALRDNRKDNWPRGRPEYLHFVLQKENVDMADAISILSQKTKLRTMKFSYAGTKDKRAVTAQGVTVRRGDAKRLKGYDYRGVAIGNFSYQPKGLRLGDLSGNRFKVVLRNVKADDDVIEDATKQLKKNGFINYFGMQRFGQSKLVPTYLVGKAILQNDWKLAVELVLKPRPGEDRFKDLSEAKETYEKTKDPFEALKCLSVKDRTIEGKILCGLKKNGSRAYQNAFDQLPRNTVTMYLHSYQSLLWNKIVSRRMKEFGLTVLPGDLVKEVLESEGKEKSERQVDGKGEDDDEENMEPDEDEMWTVRALSEEEASKASVREVCYPLPGADVMLPDNETAQWYSELLAEDGFTMDAFKHVHKKYGVQGAYRHLLECAEDLTWSIVRYSHPDEDLVLSDADQLRGRTLSTDPNGPYKAIVLEFSLNVCSYATMAVRELTKYDTSSSSQAQLTREAQEEDTANKKRKEEQDDESRKKIKAEGEANETGREQETVSEMEVNLSEKEEEKQVPTIEEDADSRNEEDMKDASRREADADNIINKYLERNYH